MTQVQRTLVDCAAILAALHELRTAGQGPHGPGTARDLTLITSLGGNLARWDRARRTLLRLGWVSPVCAGVLQLTAKGIMMARRVEAVIGKGGP